jgi:hypothetical protein
LCISRSIIPHVSQELAWRVAPLITQANDKLVRKFPFLLIENINIELILHSGMYVVGRSLARGKIPYQDSLSSSVNEPVSSMLLCSTMVFSPLSGFISIGFVQWNILPTH